MENLGKAMPVWTVPLLTALFQRQQVHVCLIGFGKAYDSVWHKGMFHHKLGTKINGSFLYT